MPSFYASRQLPLTPPEFNTGYQSNGCAGMQYPQHSYPTQTSMGRQEENGYDYSARYGQQHQASAPVQTSMIHQQPPPSYQQATVNMPPVNRWGDAGIGLPLPPVRTYEQIVGEQQYQRQQDYRPHAHYEQQKQQQAQSQPKAKEEKPVGGVSATLDYDMDWMTDFVAHNALRLVQPGKTAHEGFRNWVHGVLCATRLPSSTIILSLEYLSVRMTMLQKTQQGAPHDGQIYRLLTVALILGSKFLDDNTFVNRSWADVSLIEVKTLNQMELEWLNAIDFKLHRNADEAKGFEEWLRQWKSWEQASLTQGTRSLKLSPLNTNVQHNATVPKPFSPHSSQSAFPPPSAQDYSRLQPQAQYHTPAYAPYDPWLVPRSSNETSPMSAPHTGPTTPEYYGGPGTWAPLDNGVYQQYNSRPFGFTPLSQPRPQSHGLPVPQAAPFTPFTPQYTANPWMATQHPMHCGCGHCARQHMQPHYMYMPIAA